MKQSERTVKISSPTEGRQVLEDHIPVTLFNIFMCPLTVLYINWNAMTKPGASKSTNHIRLIKNQEYFCRNSHSNLPECVTELLPKHMTLF